MERPYRCAIFGQAPMRFPWGFDEEDSFCRELKTELRQQIMVLRQQGVTQFLVACDCGIGLYAAEGINQMRETDPDLMLLCTVPHEEQATKWAPYLRERYFDMLVKCTCIDHAADPGQDHAQLLAYRHIIDLADLMLTVFDEAALHAGRDEDQAMAYALNCGKPVLNIDPHTLKLCVLK